MPDILRKIFLPDGKLSADPELAFPAETISTVSHELRVPLTSMKSSLGLVLAGETGPVTEQQAHFLSMTMRNINRLDRLVSDLLDASKTRPGEVVLRRRELDLGPVLREALQLQETAARQAGIELKFAGLPEEFVAHVDPDKVVQMLTNVVGNSIKYTPAGGLVRVWLESRPQFDPEPSRGLAWQLARIFSLPLDTFNLVVEDSGIGMKRQEQERVFEPWFRAGEDKRGRISGAGLGLHITRGLVEAHGGRIGLASEPGQGTTVWIRLPRDPASATLLHGSRQLQTMAGGVQALAVAVLDTRAQNKRLPCPARQIVTDFLRQRPGTGDRRFVPLADDLLATVVSDPNAWAQAWTAHVAAICDEVSPIPWQFVTWNGAEAEKIRGQFCGIPAETCSRKTNIPGAGSRIFGGD